MDITMIISILLAFVSLITAFVLDGGHVHSLLEPTAAMIVFGGTFGAVGVSFKSDVLKKIPKILVIAFKRQKQDRQQIVDTFFKISNLARTSGLLSLETEIQTNTYD